jgi:acyl-[acyl-carrier-protein]-phospholipid O-acyltransferase/long-chain-fatty-acid--[acyl-carrier-protein] ligase
MRILLRLALRLRHRPRVEGVPRPAPAPLIYVALHRRASDSLLLGLCLEPRPVVVLPREEACPRWRRLWLRAIDHLVMDVNDPASVRPVLRLLAEGRSVLLFPEGRVLEADAVLKNYDVPALIAAKAGRPVVPVVVRHPNGRLAPAVVHTAASLTLGEHCPAGMGAARARRSHFTRQLQRALEAAALDARPRQGLFDAFLDAVAREGARSAIIEDIKEEPRTYREVLKGALAIGRWAARHAQPRENVGVLLPNLIPTACAVLGLMAFGRVPAMLNYTAGPMAVHSACRAAGLRTVITSRAFIEQGRLTAMVGAIRDLELLYLEDLRADLTLVDRLWLLGYALWFPRRAVPRADPHAPAVVLFTSGSETRPKGVVLSHDNILSNIRQIGTVLDFTTRDKVLNALPLYHSYSFSAGLMLCLITGVRLFLYLSPLRYRAIPEIAYRRDATYLFGTSTFLSYYARHAHATDFRTVRYIISGGEKLGEEVARMYLEKFGLRVYEGYGATECAPVIALSTPQCYRVGTVGRLLPGIEHRLAPLAGIDHGGVLHLRGPNIMLGYYRYESPGVIDPPRSQFGPGWYDTGDVVDLAEDGTLRVIGRVKRFAKIAGEMASLDAIEEIALCVSPDHRHAAVVRAESAGGETTVLFTTDPGLTRHALMNAARELGRRDLAVARKVMWMPDIPLLGSGKTDYVTLQSVDLAERAANEPGPPLPPADREAPRRLPG